MSDILFTYEVTITLFIASTLFITLSVAFVNSLYILKNYQQNATSQIQYALEKRSYLVTTIIYIASIIKIVLLPYFTFTIDKLSNIIPGAMCGAGVIDANSYGEPLIIIKILIIILTMLWLSLNKEDLLSRDFRYFRKKIWFFIFIYLLIVIEFFLEYQFFMNLTTINPVSCCSNLYSLTQDINPLPFNISTSELVFIFYFIYTLLIIFNYFQRRYILAILSIFYIYIAYLSIVYFFSTYIYQLPSHKCPYCLLQSEYYFIGYIIYSSIIVATFYTFQSILLNKNSFGKSIFWYTLATFFISLNFVFYLMINRTFL
ncbi:MAG: hypothetical protein U9P38_03455 [Campylobacterota bacterium]|nr:hypothetical protein [Campylobacterota bacterium]